MRNAFNGIYRDHMYCYRPNLLRDSLRACVCVCVCVRVFLCCSWRPLANLSSMTHTPTSPITKQHKKGQVERKSGKEGGEKKTNFGSCILHLQKVQTLCVSVFLEKLLVHTPTQRHTHTHTLTHACSVHWLQCSKIQTETSFFFIPYATHYHDPPPPPILCSDTLPVPTLAAQFFTISVLFSFMALLFFCFCPPLVVF